MTPMHLFFVPDSCGGFRRLDTQPEFEEDLSDTPVVEVTECLGTVSWELNSSLSEVR